MNKLCYTLCLLLLLAGSTVVHASLPHWHSHSVDDFPPKYYAQVLLSVMADGSLPYPYAALRIEPDRLSVIFYDGSTIQEFDSVDVRSEPGVWYTVQMRFVAGGPNFGALTLERTSDVTGDAVSLLMQSVLLSELPETEPTALGFTVSSAANYQFGLVEYANDADLSSQFGDWTYDAFGRKVAESVYGDGFTLTAQTLYVWDGWRLFQEVDGLTGKVLAEYVPGPGYVDDVVAVRRDLNRDGDFNDANEGFLYYLADQQHSTVALVNAGGTPVERYGYDAFGAPAFYDGDGIPISESAYGNNRLYTGREYLPALGLYDYRQRIYNPQTGRFLSTDPVYDPNNLGNPYTYVGNNPGAFVDPYGEERWGAQSYFADVLDVGYGYFIGGPVDLFVGTAGAIYNYDQTASGLVSLAGNLYDDPSGTASGLARSFYHQFEDSVRPGRQVSARLVNDD